MAAERPVEGLFLAEWFSMELAKPEMVVRVVQRSGVMVKRKGEEVYRKYVEKGLAWTEAGRHVIPYIKRTPIQSSPSSPSSHHLTTIVITIIIISSNSSSSSNTHNAFGLVVWIGLVLPRFSNSLHLPFSYIFVSFFNLIDFGLYPNISTFS